MDGGEVHEATFTVARYGGTYSIRRVVLCGFRPQVPDHRPECPVVWMASEPHAVAA